MAEALWEPIPEVFWSQRHYDTFEQVCEAMRKAYPQSNRPDLWEKYPNIFLDKQSSRDMISP